MDEDEEQINTKPGEPGKVAELVSEPNEGEGTERAHPVGKKVGATVVPMNLDAGNTEGNDKDFEKYEKLDQPPNTMK